jgi:hypothetical protein
VISSLPWRWKKKEKEKEDEDENEEQWRCSENLLTTCLLALQQLYAQMERGMCSFSVGFSTAPAVEEDLPWGLEKERIN